MAGTTHPPITLYQYAGLERDTTLSPPCGKVRMALAFKGLAFAVHDCRTPAEVLRYNPRGRVPVLEIDLKDRATILRELDAHLAALVELLAGRPFLVGEVPSRADLAVAAVLDQLAIEALTPEAARLIAVRGALEAWRERVHRLAPDQTRRG